MSKQVMWIVATEDPFGGAETSELKLFNDLLEAKNYQKTRELETITKQIEILSNQKVWFVLSEDPWGGLDHYPKETTYMSPDCVAYTYFGFSIHYSEQAAKEAQSKLPVESVIWTY